jgi:PAS domain S-box-containing protein
MRDQETTVLKRRSEHLFFLSGGGEMGNLMRSLDWTQTPLGPPSAWPQAMQTAVSICLNSRFPMVLWLGPELTMLYNDGWRPVLGATKHPSGLGRPGREVWPEIWDIIGEQMHSVMSTGVATWSDDLLLVVDRYNYPEEAYFTYSYSPIFTSDGNVCGVFSAVSETTLRVIGERRLKTLSELGALVKAKTTAEASNLSADVLRRNDADIPFALIYLLSADGSKAELSRTVRLEAASAVSPGEIPLNQDSAWELSKVAVTQRTLIVDNLQSRFGPLPGGRWPAVAKQALVLPLRSPGRAELAGILVGGVSPYRQLDDDYERFYELVAGHITTSIANARAYEEAQKRAEMLAEIDRAKTAFFSNVSHEFRTPLTLMLGPSEDILAMPDETDLRAIRELVAVIHRNGLRLQRLVNTLLDFSRIEAGRVQASYTSTDLATFTVELASSFRSAMDRAGISYHVHAHTLSEPVFLDREMWEKIVLNLISNAFKYTLEGSVTVTVAERDGHAEFSVADTGVGIPEQELPRIFERFHRVESVHGRTHEGTGIGLALVQELVKLHGGSVAVESSVGRGTKFTVSIPFGTAHLPHDRIGADRALTSTALHAETYVEEALRWLAPNQREVAQPSREEFELVPSQNRPNHVLVADDNADMRDYVRRLLETRYTVTTVGNGKEALDLALANPPDLVLTDVMMPELDGFELVKRLRSVPETKTIPVILLSARAGEESRVEGLDAGADDYLVKPFAARELLARVDAHLSLARMRREADEARRLSEVRLGLALESANMIAWEWDPLDDRVVATGDLKRIFGANIQTSIEGFALLDAEDEPQHRAKFERIALHGGSYFSEFRIRRGDNGQTRWLEERASAVVAEMGHVARVVGVLTDITQRKTAEEEMRQRNAELERANNELEEFAYVASHDLQEPLRTVNIYTDLLLRTAGLQNDERLSQFASFIHDGVRRMELLIGDLLSYARVVHREQEPPSAVRVSGAFKEALNALRGLMVETGAVVTCNCDEPVVRGDETQLAQVFQNLLSNSIKYRRPEVPPRISINAQKAGDEWLLAFVDNGIGFEPEYGERIFGLFKRLHKQEYPGTGLGLAICKRIVERYGGRIWASSEGEGKGATFHVALKAATL